MAKRKQLADLTFLLIAGLLKDLRMLGGLSVESPNCYQNDNRFCASGQCYPEGKIGADKAFLSSEGLF